MTTCIILNNMIIEDEREFDAPTELVKEAPPPDIEIPKLQKMKMSDLKIFLFDLGISKIKKLCFIRKCIS